MHATADRLWGLVLARLEPGDDVIGCLQEAVRHLAAPATVHGAVGSLRSVTFAWASADEQGRVSYTEPCELRQPLELIGLHGHIAYNATDETPYHLHGSVATCGGQVVGGHVVAAQVLATLEVALRSTRGIGWQRRYLTEHPARTPLPVLEPLSLVHKT